MSAKSVSTGGHHLDKFRQEFLTKTPLAWTRTANEAPQNREHEELAQVVPVAHPPWLASLSASWRSRQSFQQSPGADSDF